MRRVRINDSVEHIGWLSKTPFPKADNRKVLRPYCGDMLRLAKKGVKATVRPSGRNITSSFDKIESGGSIPSKVLDDQVANELLIAGNNSANDPYTMRCKGAGIKIHPARFPTALPEFFVQLLIDVGNLMVDPFAGSNTAGMVAERLGRRWIGMELLDEYLGACRAWGRACAGASFGASLGVGEAWDYPSQRADNNGWHRKSPRPFGLKLAMG